ncbi:MAG: hypothetical protein K9N06_13020 [Candidatus Cloacimonetes bacterium]|nr:hypothetical protein [Candidatus Cloacimonadota bacterium]
MKKRVLVILLMLTSLCLLAQRPHPVVVDLVTSGGLVPSGSGGETVEFTGDLYRAGSTIGVQVDETTNVSTCFYYNGTTHGVIYIDVNQCTSSWAFGDVLKINVTCNSEIGQAIISVGSLGDNIDEVPTGQGIQLLIVTEVEFTGDTGTADLDNGDFSITKTGTGTVQVSAPASDFSSLPGISRDGRADNVDQCFSVDFTSGISQLATSFSWASDDITGSMSDKDLLVSIDGVNWIYSDNSESGISGDVNWSYSSPDMTVTFTTTQDNALYAVSNGTNPEVTTPNAPSGGTATANGASVTISCRAVAVPGATYQVYYSNDFSNWNTIGTTFSASGGTAFKTVTHSMGANDIMYYGIKAYNDNTSYQSAIGKVIYTYQKTSFETTSGNMTNLIPIPFNEFNNNFDTARLLGNQLGANCNAVVKWNAETQRYSYCTCYAGAWRGDFALEPDGIYFVNLTGTVDPKTCNGILNRSDFALKTGINLIYVSALDAALTYASDLMSDIGAPCTKVQQWNTDTQTWSTYTGSETDFTISRLNPVFVYVDANTNYTK